MSCIVSRTCTEVPPNDAEQERDARSRPLADFQAASAYVLLGDPGCGKSTSFEAERDGLGEKAYLVTARDFRALDPDAHPEWRGKTLFIDGLDEVRAGGGDARTPLDELRRRIDALGRPRFRLSCREADWLGTNDRVNLAKVSPDAGLTVLRLDPLTNENVEEMLNAHSGIDDPRSFIATATDKGVAGFLENPQCLNMLADVVATGEGWPESRLELFEQACLQMVREHNEEHITAAERSSASAAAPEDDLLDAAGRLCAVILISGSAGCAIASRRENTDYPDLNRCSRREQGERCRQAVSTKLFTAVAEGRFQPVHRHVAEFLAGRHLCRLIEGEKRNGWRVRYGVPARRIVSLITGHDGEVVTALRGLSAWLAAQCPVARSHLVERDPVGVGLYGDAGRFSQDEKRTLLGSLRGQASRLAPVSRTAAAFRALATPELETAFPEILTDSSRAHEHQAFLLFLLSLLAHGSPLPGLSEILLGIVRDDTWSPVINAKALDALVHNCPDGLEKTHRLRELLADAYAGRISDSNGELLGTLLTQLYPDDLSPSGVWAYLSETANPVFGGRYSLFWKSCLVDGSSVSAIAEHLDVLAARRDALLPVLESRGLQEVPVRLLVRGLEALGNQVETNRLSNWLGAGQISDLSRLSDNSLGSVRRWLAERPAVQKAVINEGLTRCAELEGNAFWQCSNELERRLYGTAWPDDFAHWCLERAETAADRRVAEYFLRHAMTALHTPAQHQGLSLGVLERRVQAHHVLAGIYVELQMADRGTDLTLQRNEQRRRRRLAKEDREREERLVYIRRHEAALRENRGPPALLHQLAAAYFGQLIEADGQTPRARLRSLFGADERLAEAALTGLGRTIFRADLPDVDEIIRLRGQKREHYLALPTLVSLEEIEEETPGESGRLDTDLACKALAFYYCTRGLPEPDWYGRMVGLRPGLVADVLIRSAASEIRNGREHVSGLSELAYGQEHAQVARIASLPLLRAFPIRCAARQMTDLCYLLWSAIRHADPHLLLRQIACKLTRSSMSIAQRARWLAAGLILSPETYLEPTEDFAAGGEQRVRHLFALFDRHPLQLFPMDRLGVPALQLVIRLAGSTFGTSASNAADRVTRTPDMSAAESVQWMIRGLAEFPTHEASVALDALASDPGLSLWRAELVRARDDQRVVRRDAAYRHPDVDQSCRTLDDGPPANPADLAALTADRLDEIARRIRNDNINGWRPFWNEDRHRHALVPKHEESCRDALRVEMRHWLPDQVDAQAEGHYANDKRADIRISCRDFQIPIEIKKNGHRKLWSALRDQLITQYTRDPATDGYGIYAVLWFGEVDGHRTPPPPSGVRPDGADALKARLEETLKPEEARKISVCVIDVSAPPDKNRRR